MNRIDYVLMVMVRADRAGVSERELKVLASVARLEVAQCGRVAERCGLPADETLRVITRLCCRGMMRPVSLARPRQYRLTDDGGRLLMSVFDYERGAKQER